MVCYSISPFHFNRGLRSPFSRPPPASRERTAVLSLYGLEKTKKRDQRYRLLELVLSVVPFGFRTCK